MNKLIGIITLAVVLFACQRAPAAPSREGILASVMACKRCGSHYLSDLKKITMDRPLAMKLFLARKSIYFPGTKSKKEVARLAEIFYQSLKVWYSFLTDAAYKPNSAFLHRIVDEMHLETGARAEAAMMLYCMTHRIRYGVIALRLQPLQATVFENAADPQFGEVLARLLTESIAEKGAAGNLRIPGLTTPTETLRAEYATLAGAAYFQKVPPGLVDLLFSRYKSLELSPSAKVSRWEVEALTEWPFLARRVIKHIQKFGPAAEKQFIKSLARQGCSHSLRDIVKAYPKLAGMVRNAVASEARRARKNAVGLESGMNSSPMANALGSPKARAVAGAASLRPVAQSVDFGVLLPGGSVSRHIAIPNHSKNVVSIMRVIPSCGCTHAVLASHLIPAGSATTLDARVLIHPWAGPARISVLLLGRSGDKPWSHVVHIFYRTRRLLRVIFRDRDSLQTADHLDLGVFPFSKTVPMHCEITLERGGYPSVWNRVRCRVSPDLLTSAIKKVAKGKWSLILAQTGRRYLGAQSCTLNFSFFNNNVPLAHVTSIPVTFSVRGPMEINPSSISFGPIGPGSHAERTARLSETVERAGATFKIVSAAPSKNAPLTTRVIDDGQAVAVRLRAPSRPGNIVGDVVITVTGQGQTYQFREDYLGDVTTPTKNSALRTTATTRN